jgi:hypothetical protein
MPPLGAGGRRAGRRPVIAYTLGVAARWEARSASGRGQGAMEFKSQYWPSSLRTAHQCSARLHTNASWAAGLALMPSAPALLMLTAPRDRRFRARSSTWSENMPPAAALLKSGWEDPPPLPPPAAGTPAALSRRASSASRPDAMVARSSSVKWGPWSRVLRQWTPQ